MVDTCSPLPLFPIYRSEKQTNKQRERERAFCHLLSLACLGRGKQMGFVRGLCAAEAMEDAAGRLGWDQILKSLYTEEEFGL